MNGICQVSLVTVEIFRVTTPIKRLQVLDALYVMACLREDDPLPVRPPAVDIVLARVVRRERGALVAVLVDQVAQVPGSVAHVDLRIVEIADPEARATR